MTSFFEYDLPFNEQEERVIGWAREALDLRHGDAGDPKGSIRGWGSSDDSPTDVLDLLLRVRQRSDRVDQLLANVTMAKSRAKRAHEEATFAAEIAKAEATKEYANSGRRREFASAKETDSEATLQSLEQLRTAHRAARLVSVTSEAYDVVNQIHWQLESIRKDLRATLHALQFESSLER